VAEWATRAAHFGRMVSRAYPAATRRRRSTGAREAWRSRTGPSRLEGEVASHMRKLEALERRGRALRAEIGRKVEELAQEESGCCARPRGRTRSWRRCASGCLAGERNVGQSPRAGRQAERQGLPLAQLRAVFERAGQAQAHVDAKREVLAEHEMRAARKDAQARDLRRQIEELRAQLARYAEAMEEDLAQGRERVARAPARGSQYERSFAECTDVLMRHLRGRPECRDLLEELSRNDAARGPQSSVVS
jgi:hypothetical protein